MDEQYFEGFVTITIPNVLVHYLGDPDEPHVPSCVHYAVESLLDGSVDPIRATFEIRDEDFKTLRTVKGSIVLKVDGPFEQATILDEEV